MARASYRGTGVKQGTGRFVVSEGVAPAEALLPHLGLPTLRLDPEDNRFEVVIAQGTILSVVEDGNGDSWIVPANGSGSNVNWDDNNDGGQATPGGGDAFTVPARSVPIGAAIMDLWRPFDRGTSQIAGWTAKNYVEWPLVESLNDDIKAGDLVRADAIGRPVKCSTVDAASNPHIVVARVVKVEKFGGNYDHGLLDYMQIPKVDPGVLEDVYSITAPGPFTGLFGVRTNLDVPKAVGAFRANMTL